MSDCRSYELLDFGAGRKLERFGRYIVDRPAPAAEGASRENLDVWNEASARFERTAKSVGHWEALEPIDEDWTIQLGPLTLALKLTDSGQVGVFPEQADNWRWIEQQVREAGPIELLNLFGYTGASTLAAAAAGARVVHVDAARSAVVWARRNAELSGLSEAPIRWIVDDALQFARRELKRGRHYDAIVLDPPAYGQGPGGKRFKLEHDLGDLLDVCRQLGGGSERFWLLTCHTEPLADKEALADCFAAHHPAWLKRGILRSEAMGLSSPGGLVLPGGAAVRASRDVC